MLCIHHYSVVHNSFTALKILRPAPTVSLVSCPYSCPPTIHAPHNCQREKVHFITFLPCSQPSRGSPITFPIKFRLLVPALESWSDQTPVEPPTTNLLLALPPIRSTTAKVAFRADEHATPRPLPSLLSLPETPFLQIAMCLAPSYQAGPCSKPSSLGRPSRCKMATLLFYFLP